MTSHDECIYETFVDLLADILLEQMEAESGLKSETATALSEENSKPSII
jgi:hypothetical protein